MPSSLMFLLILTGVSCEDLTALQKEEFSPEGSSVTLSYRADKGVSFGDFFFWYRQYPGKPPEFLISSVSGGVGTLGTLGMEIKSNQIYLSLSSAALSDSAVYYCAVRNDGGGYKIIFGRATRVTVETKEEYKPSFYKLEDESTSLCLATGFSRIRAADKDKSGIFNNRTGAVRIEGDSLFSQVGYLSSGQKCETGGGPVDCDDSLQPDPQVNLVSLTVLGLRLLFMKTVVFNVLLTLRLWITS